MPIAERGIVPPDPREPLGRIVHETRRSFGAALDRPMIPAPWEERHPKQRELDMQIAAAVVADALPELAAAQALLDSVERRARVWAALPEGELRRAGMDLLGLIRPQDQERGDEGEAG
jgi:hypothetical protein